MDNFEHVAVLYDLLARLGCAVPLRVAPLNFASTVSPSIADVRNIHVGERVTLVAVPRKDFVPLSFYISPCVGPDFLIIDIRIDGQSVFANAPTPFSPNGDGHAMPWPMPRCPAGERVEIDVENRGAADRPFWCTLFGEERG